MIVYQDGGRAVCSDVLDGRIAILNPAIGWLKDHGFRMNEEAFVRDLNDHTLNYYFDYFGHEVSYRETPQGPEVLAVGDEEILALTGGMSLEEQLKLWSCLPG